MSMAAERSLLIGSQIGRNIFDPINSFLDEQTKQKFEKEKYATQLADTLKQLALTNPEIAAGIVGTPTSTTVQGQQAVSPLSLTPSQQEAFDSGKQVQDGGFVSVGGQTFDPAKIQQAGLDDLARKFQQKVDLEKAIYGFKDSLDQKREDRNFTNDQKLFDYKSGIQNQQQLQELEKKAQLARENGDYEAQRDYEIDMKLLQEKARLFPQQGKGAKPLPRQIGERLSDAANAVDQLIRLGSYLDQPEVKAISGPVAGRTLGKNPFSSTVGNFDGVRNTAKQNIGKYMEGGVLRAEDEKKYDTIIPSKNMLPDVQQNQKGELYLSLRNKVVRDLESYRKSGYDVSEYEGLVEQLDKAFGGIPGEKDGAGPAKVSTKEEHDALPPGAEYIGPDGHVARKKQ